MAMHIADRLGGAEHLHLEGSEQLPPFEHQPDPGPAPEHMGPVEGPSNWLEQLPPLALHPDVGHVAPAWGEPLGDNALMHLPAPAVTARTPGPAPDPAVASTAATQEAAAPAPAATAVATTPPTAAAPVDATWLAQREAALLALRADFNAAQQEALALSRDIIQPPNAPAFSQAAFAEQFLANAVAQGNAAWKTLADLYGTDPATLVGRHSELLSLALSEHALNAGPPPPGRAMGSVQQLGVTDLVLADPLMREIADTFGRTPEAPRTALAWEQVRIYGQVRYDAMTRLHVGMEAVRDTYSAAMGRAADSDNGPGWVDVEVERQQLVADSHGETRSQSVTLTERRFDPDAFTRWYNAQDGLANRAFAQLYGNSHTERQAPASVRGNEPAAHGPGAINRIRFDNAPWHMDGLAAPMRRDGLIGLDLNTAPRMRNDAAVGFDFEVGWATAPDNIYDKPSTTRQVAQLAVVVAVSYFTWNPVNVWATTATGGAVTGAMVAGAAAAAASTLASGVMNGNVELKDIVRSAFSAALTAGLMGGATELGLLTNGSSVGNTLVRMTVQGGVQALMGGEFKDGAALAFASSLAQAVGDGLNTAIARTLPADQVSAAQSVVRVVTSAIRALGNPDDPLGAFASSFLQDVLQDSGLAESQPASQTTTVSGTLEPGHHIDPAVAHGQPERDWLGLSSSGTGNSGLRLSPDAIGEFQDQLQAGIDRVAADPAFDGTRYAQERLAERPAEDHSPGPWSDADQAPIWLAGRFVPRPPPQATAGQGLQVGTNQRANAVFNALTNAPPGEAFGLIPAAYRDIRFAAPLLSESRLLGEIERMRSLLGQSGIDATPVKLGAVPNIDASGRISFNSADVAERYANAIRLLELRRQGVVELDISTLTVTSVGTARIAPDVLIRNVEERYQAAFAAGFQEAEQRLAAGERLRYPVDMPQQLRIGLEADRVAKVAVGVYLRSVGVPEGPGQTVALNRWAYDQIGSGLFVRPDVLFDFGPNHRHWIDGKSSFANSGVMPQQLRSFFDYTGSRSGTIATPGGSINVRAPRGRP